MSIPCTACDEGYVERDVSHGDYTVAGSYKCDVCDGTQVMKCVYQCGRNADVVDGDPICRECLAAEGEADPEGML